MNRYNEIEKIKAKLERIERKVDQIDTKLENMTIRLDNAFAKAVEEIKMEIYTYR